MYTPFKRTFTSLLGVGTGGRSAGVGGGGQMSLRPTDKPYLWLARVGMQCLAEREVLYIVRWAAPLE